MDRDLLDWPTSTAGRGRAPSAVAVAARSDVANNPERTGGRASLCPTEAAYG